MIYYFCIFIDAHPTNAYHVSYSRVKAQVYISRRYTPDAQRVISPGEQDDEKHSSAKNGNFYQAQKDAENRAISWTTAHAEAGNAGDLGTTEWRLEHTFAGVKTGGRQRNCKLVFEISQMKKHPDKIKKRKNKKLNFKRDEQIIGWAAIDIFMPDAGTEQPVIKKGRHRLTVYDGAVDWQWLFDSSLPDRRSKDRDAIKRGSEPPPSSTSSLYVLLFDPQTPPSIKPVELLLNNSGSSLPYLSVPAGKRNNKAFAPGDGFDVYVDSARFLPSNCSITSVSTELYASGTNEPYSRQSKELGVCNADAEVGNPAYNFRCEYRNGRFDPTSILCFWIDTIDVYTKDCKCVGVALLNAFVKRGTYDAPISSNEQEYALNTGSFQIPIYWYKVDPGQQFNPHNLANQLARVPCATLLVRIRQAPRSIENKVLSTSSTPEAEWESSGLVAPAPLYGNSVYDSTRCLPTSTEQSLYKALGKRKPIKVTDIIPRLSEEGETLDLENSEIVSTWINDKLLASKRSEDVRGRVMIPVLDPLYRYSPMAGFNVAVDGGNNIARGQKLSFSIFSLNPPGSYYQEFKLTNQVDMTVNVDMESLLKAPRWLDSFQPFRDVSMSPFAVLVIDVRTVAFDKKMTGSFSKLSLVLKRVVRQALRRSQTPLIKRPNALEFHSIR